MCAITLATVTIDAPPLEQIIGGAEIQEYALSLAVGQFVAVTAVQNGVDVVVEVYAPDGTSLMKVDSSNGNGAPKDALITATADGTYRVVVCSREQSGPGKYTLAARSARLFSTERAQIKSPRLRQLWEELLADVSGGSEAVAKFVRERKEAKGPLIEAIPEEDNLVLATLVYQGDAHTRTMMVRPAPAVDGHLPMERFANTDLWTASMTIPNDTRLYYGFLVRKAMPLPTGETSPPLLFSEEEVPDPWNPLRSITDDQRSEFVLPATPVQPYVQEPAPGTPRGNVEQQELQSKILNQKRPYTVYTPPGYDPKRKGAYGVLILFDGEMYSTEIPTPTILDNLIAAQKIPAMIAVLIHSLETRSRDFTCSIPFLDFLTTELLPTVCANYPGATKRARKTIIGGASLGGFCAAYCALTRSETFGNVLSQVGSFWAHPGYEKEGNNAIPHISTRFRVAEGTIPTTLLKSKRLPVRFYLNVGTFEGHGQLRPNRHVRDILVLKGYDVTYSEFHGGHDVACCRDTLPDGLVALTRKWPRG